MRTDMAERIEAERDGLSRYALKLCRNDADANDLVQDTIVMGIEKQHKYKEDNLAGWLKMVMYRIFITKLRNRDRHIRLTTKCHTERSDIVKTTPLDILIEKERTRDPRIAYALKFVREPFRTAVELHFQGLQMKEVAAALKIPTGTAFSRICRGKAIIKDKVVQLPKKAV